MSTDIDYYKNLWTTTQGKGAQFFKNVDFNIPPYQYQEKVFRAYLHDMILKQDIHSVLELGAGTGRMTKIMLKELPNIERYDAVDIKMVFNPTSDNKLSWINMDIMSKEFDIVFGHMDYDLIFASEVFMHIKPEDIDYIISRLSKIGKQIINIDLAFLPNDIDWCFIHPYRIIYNHYGAREISRVDMKRIQQSLFHYRFDN